MPRAATLTTDLSGELMLVSLPLDPKHVDPGAVAEAVNLCGLLIR